MQNKKATRDVAKRLSELILAKYKNINVFCQELDMDKCGVYGWIRGTHSLSLGSLLRVIDLLELSDEDILWVLGR